MSQRSCLLAGEPAMMIDPAPEEIEVLEISEGRHGASRHGLSVWGWRPNSGLCHDVPMFLAGWCFKLKHH
jgi:hypothetical protein